MLLFLRFMGRGPRTPDLNASELQRKEKPTLQRANVRKANGTLPTRFQGRTKGTIRKNQKLREEAEQEAEYETEQEAKRRLSRHKKVGKTTVKAEEGS